MVSNGNGSSNGDGHGNGQKKPANSMVHGTHSRARQAVVARRKRREELAKLILRGVTDQRKLAEKLGVSASTISRDIVKLEDQWHKESVEHIDRMKARKLRELDKIKEEAWDAWDKSKGKFHKVVKKEKKPGGPEEAGEVEVTSTVEERVGDFRFLAIVKDCIDKEADLLGLKVTKIAPTDPSGEKTYHEAVMQQLAKLAEEIGEGPTVIDAEFVEAEVQRLEHKAEDEGDGD